MIEYAKTKHKNGCGSWAENSLGGASVLELFVFSRRIVYSISRPRFTFKHPCLAPNK